MLGHPRWVFFFFCQSNCIECLAKLLSSQRQKVGTAAFAAPVNTGRTAKKPGAPGRDTKQQPSASQGSHATRARQLSGSRETGAGLTTSALQTQPGEDLNSQVDERLRRFFSSTQGELPDFTSSAQPMPVVYLPPSSATGPGQTQPQHDAPRPLATQQPVLNVLQNKTNHPLSGRVSCFRCLASQSAYTDYSRLFADGRS